MRNRQTILLTLLLLVTLTFTAFAARQGQSKKVVKPKPNLPNKEKTKINAKDGAVMKWIPAGEFMMGGDIYDYEKPIQKVTISKGFWMYQNVVTVAQYRKFCAATDKAMPEAPSWGWKDNHPIVNVTWNDAKAYCDWAGAKLPTEAQWEYAARGGLQGKAYPWGDKWDATKLHCSKIEWGDAKSTAPVGSYPANGYGLHDMAGNVWHWCADWYDANYYKNSPDADPTGASTGSERVLRGGSWSNNNPDLFRAANRFGLNPDSRVNIFGFRCVFGLQ